MTVKCAEFVIHDVSSLNQKVIFCVVSIFSIVGLMSNIVVVDAPQLMAYVPNGYISIRAFLLIAVCSLSFPINLQALQHPLIQVPLISKLHGQDLGQNKTKEGAGKILVEVWTTSLVIILGVASVLVFRLVLVNGVLRRGGLV